MNRIRTAAKFFFDGERKFFVQGVSYGPFRPREGVHLPEPGVVAVDFRLMGEAGINTVRVYHPPPRWFLDAAEGAGLRVLATLPWPLRGLFLEDRRTRREIVREVREGARQLAGHAAVFGVYVDNEMAPDLVRWLGARKVRQFLDTLISTVKGQDDRLLVSYAGFPPTEYLFPENADFASFNVYLHDRDRFAAYVDRLHNLAGERPLMIGEFGMDTLRHGEEEQAEMLRWHQEEAVYRGLAGTVWFSFTDEWHTGGHDIENWAFGLVDRERRPKASYRMLQQARIGPGEPLWKRAPREWLPRVSVVVCTYNGGPTLWACLDFLRGLHYPDYEVIVVDDGSTDNTREILQEFPTVRAIHQENKGLSVARNVGAEAATGEIIAYTDSDCMPDKDWLFQLVLAMRRGNHAAVGGPNISPPAQQWVQAAVAAAPGSPSHVLFTDTEAEHVPGCNMAFYKWALEMIGGFDPVYRKAGDDVDVCWRLMQTGHRIGFAPAAVVWHHRRFTVKAYFGQQRGYGEAEALLRYKHLNYFDTAGTARWRGVIYGGPAFHKLLGEPVIYHGEFGMGYFQCLYPAPMPAWVYVVGSLQWAMVTLVALLASAALPPLRVVPLVMFALTLASALYHMAAARVEPRHDRLCTRLLLFYLSLAQPWARAWARYFTWLEGQRTPETVLATPEQIRMAERRPWWGNGRLEFWCEDGHGRERLLPAICAQLKREGWRFVADNGWSTWDVQVFANRWWHVRLRTQSEAYPGGRMLTRLSNDLVVNSFSWLAGLPLALILVVAVVKAPWGLLWWAGVAAGVAGYWAWQGWRAWERLGDLVQVAGHEAGLDLVAQGRGR